MKARNMPLTEEKKLASQNKEAKKTFILKLYDIVEVNHSVLSLFLSSKDPNNSEYISWSADGLSILLKDQKCILENVLPKYFFLTSYHSFLRQVAFY